MSLEANRVFTQDRRFVPQAIRSFSVLNGHVVGPRGRVRGMGFRDLSPEETIYHR